MAEVKSASQILDEIREPETVHTLVYDSVSDTLEPIYFFVLDMMESFRLAPEKLVDNFTSSPGSGHFAELGQRATLMQQHASRVLGDVNTVLRSVLNIIYDLKEFKIRLQHYKDLKSKDKAVSDGARLALKQIWMDRVDILKGNSSIKAMSVQMGFQTLIDAFLSVNVPADADKLDLNDIIKRIVKPRILEFNIWLDESDKELRKRYELERTYLKSQVNSLKLYSRWVKPYLRAAQKLEMKDIGKSPSLVTAFNTIVLELSLLGKKKLDIKEAIDSEELPPEIKKIAKYVRRDYYSILLIDFNFRGIPSRISVQQPNYVFGGKTTVSFRGYALNDDELKKFQQELEKSEIEDALIMVEGATAESIDQLQDEINAFLEEEEAEKKEEKKPKDDSNPFLALFGKYEESEKKKEEKKKDEKAKIEKIIPDNFIEATQLRLVAAERAKDMAFDFFDRYKKAHAMPSYT